jgi:hypothetical protein
MSTKADATELRISSYMNLEQAMEEVRAHLEAKKNYVEIRAELGNVVAGQLSMQGTLISRMAEISTRLGQVEPNSKLGPPGVLLKRILKKLIGWHAKPAQEFDRTAVDAFQQIRQDMLQLQQQIAELSKKVDAGESLPFPNAESTISGRETKTDRDELLSSMLALFRSLIAAPAVQTALQNEKPELLQRVERLLTTAEAESRSKSRRSDAARP